MLENGTNSMLPNEIKLTSNEENFKSVDAVTTICDTEKYQPDPNNVPLSSMSNK